MQAWVIAALIPCIEEAGGVATDLSGRRDGVVWNGSLLTSPGPALHRRILDLLRPAPAPP